MSGFRLYPCKQVHTPCQHSAFGKVHSSFKLQVSPKLPGVATVVVAAAAAVVVLVVVFVVVEADSDVVDEVVVTKSV